MPSGFFLKEKPSRTPFARARLLWFRSSLPPALPTHGGMKRVGWFGGRGSPGPRSLYTDRRDALIWSDPVNLCTSVGLFFLLSLFFPFIENRASRSRGRFERRLISLIFAGRNRIILIRRELPLTSVASPAVPVA